MKDFVLYYSGWCVLSPDTNFIHIDNGDVISLEDYAALDEDSRSNYILQNACTAISESTDGSWESLNIEEEENT